MCVLKARWQDAVARALYDVFGGARVDGGGITAAGLTSLRAVLMRSPVRGLAEKVVKLLNKPEDWTHVSFAEIVARTDDPAQAKEATVDVLWLVANLADEMTVSEGRRLRGACKARLVDLGAEVVGRVWSWQRIKAKVEAIEKRCGVAVGI